MAGQSGAGGVEEGVERIALVPDDEASRCYRSPGALHEPGQDRRLGWQFIRVDTERLGRTVLSPCEVRQVLPVLVGDRLEFFGRPAWSVSPPRRHETQLHQLQQSEREQAGLAVKAHVHHWAFLTALADESERVPRPGSRELLQPGPGGKPDPLFQLVSVRVRSVEIRDAGKKRDGPLIGSQKGQQGTRHIGPPGGRN